MANAFVFGLRPVPAAVAYARACVEGALEASDLCGLRDRMVWITSELVTNALLHGTGPAELVVLMSLRATRIEVRDHNADPPHLRVSEGGDRNHGWGLVVVDELADRWGFTLHGDSKTVWAEVDLSRLRPPRYRLVEPVP